MLFEAHCPFGYHFIQLIDYNEPNTLLRYRMSFYINKIFNVGGAWEKLQGEHPMEFSEVQMSLASVESAKAVNELKGKVVDRLSMMNWKSGAIAGGPANFNEFRSAPSTIDRLSIAVHKNSVGVDIGIGHPLNLDSWVSYRAKTASSLGVLPILILPIYDGLNRGMRVSFDYAMQRTRYLDLVEGNSFLLVGCSEEYTPIEVIDADRAIRRTIHFEPHQIQAGIGLLHYFSEVLKQEYGDSKNRVSIEQDEDGETVRLIIKSEVGTEHKVEALLNEYGEVLNKTKSPHELMSDPRKAELLEKKLISAEQEAQDYKEAILIMQSDHKEHIQSLNREVASLTELLSLSITSHHVAQEQISKLIEKYGSANELELELLSFAKKLDERAADVQKDELERLLKQLESENPKMAKEFLFLLKGPLEGVVGNIIYSWLPQLSSLIGTVVR